MAETLPVAIVCADRGRVGRDDGRQVLQRVDHVLQGINIHVFFLFLSILILFDQGLQAKISVAAIAAGKVGEVRGTGRPGALMAALVLLLLLLLVLKGRGSRF